MRLVLTSDLHGFLPEIPPCDLLLIAGDVVPRKEHRPGKQRAWLKEYFFPWLAGQPAEQAFFVAGNHDFAFEDQSWVQQQSKDYLYLKEVKYQGITIWGSPYSLGGVPVAFQKSRKDILALFQEISPAVDIIISHGPMHGVLDSNQGIKGLRDLVEQSSARLFLSGHIHGASGFALLGETLCISASLCSKNKVPENPLWIVDWGLTGIRDFRSLYTKVDRSAVPKAVRYGKKRNS